MSSMSISTVQLPTSHAASGGLGATAKPSFIVAIVLLVTLGYTTPLTEGWTLSLTEHYGFDERLETYAAEGTLLRQLALGSLGLFGLAAVVLPGGRRLRIAGPMGLLAVSYLAWCGASSLWADEPTISFRRFAALLCEAVAALAVAKRTSARQFAWIVVSCTLTWMTLGILAELSLGTMRPWLSGYRFSGIFHPNRMSVNCSVLVLSSMYLYVTGQYQRKWLLGVAALAFAMVLLAASRSALGAMIVAAAVVWALTAPRRHVFVGALSGFWLAALGVLLMGILQVSVTGDSISLGRADNDPSSLTGRLPLWEDLFHYIGQRPFIGHGYNSFWTVDHIREISDVQSWSISTAHSTYLDLLLNVGIVGAFLCLSTLLLALLRAIRLGQKIPGAGYGFIAATILYGLTAGFFETTFGMSWFWQFFVLSSVSYMAFVDVDSPRSDVTPEVASRFPSRPVLGDRIH
jgi:exopolysaccharide production protein ExoQ